MHERERRPPSLKDASKWRELLPLSAVIALLLIIITSHWSPYNKTDSLPAVIINFPDKTPALATRVPPPPPLPTPTVDMFPHEEARNLSQYLRPHHKDGDPFFRAATMLLVKPLEEKADYNFATAPLVLIKGQLWVITLQHIAEALYSGNRAPILIIPGLTQPGGDLPVAIDLGRTPPIPFGSRQTRDPLWLMDASLLAPLVDSRIISPLTLASKPPPVGERITVTTRVLKNGSTPAIVKGRDPNSPGAASIILSDPLCGGNSGSPVLDPNGELVGLFSALTAPVLTAVPNNQEKGGLICGQNGLITFTVLQ